MVDAASRASRRRRAAYAALGLASLFSAALVVVRYAYSHQEHHGGLVWNLFLAWIPFLVAVRIYDRHRAGAHPLALLPLGAIWLLFLPNAPYIVTDFKHLIERPPVPLWFDIVVIATPAWTGMLLGFFSLYLVQAVVRDVWGERASWALVVAACGLSSFGIYLGRVLRWNSWDVLVRPRELGHDILAAAADPASHPRAVAMTVLLTGFLTLMYAALYSFTRLEPGRDD